MNERERRKHRLSENRHLTPRGESIKCYTRHTTRYNFITNVISDWTPNTEHLFSDVYVSVSVSVSVYICFAALFKIRIWWWITDTKCVNQIEYVLIRYPNNSKEKQNKTKIKTIDDRKSILSARATIKQQQDQQYYKYVSKTSRDIVYVIHLLLNVPAHPQKRNRKAQSRYFLLFSIF